MKNPKCEIQIPNDETAPVASKHDSSFVLRHPFILHHALFIIALILLHSSVILRAQSYSIDWFTIAAGGGTSTNGQFAVSGTIGQHDAGGPMTGGNYSLTGGFWALYSVVQTPGAPTLYIMHSGNTVTVYWQAASGWSLQQNSNLATTTGWSASSGVTTSNGTNYWSIAQPTGNLFFQLKSQ